MRVNLNCDQPAGFFIRVEKKATVVLMVVFFGTSNYGRFRAFFENFCGRHGRC
jgi:hypothetical protein